MQKMFRSLLLAAFTGVMSIGSVVPLQAVTVYTLSPGGFVTALASPFPSAPGTLIGSSFAQFSTATISGNLLSRVYTNDVNNPYGGLTFTYFLTVSNQSPQSVSEFTVSAFDAFLTDVSMNTNLSGSISPSNFSRSDEGGGSGQVIRVHFLNPTVGPGDRAASVIVQTSAFAWTATTAGIIDGQTVNVSSLAPLPVPEPGVGALLLLGLGGLGVRKLRRRT